MAQNNKIIDMPIPEVKTPILAPEKIKIGLNEMRWELKRSRRN